MLKSKIHRATVTDVNLHYEGSLTVDRLLMDAADMLTHERAEVLCLDNGNRFAMYVIEGEAGSGALCVNSAAARLVQPGDVVLVLTYSVLTEDEAKSAEPTIVHVDDKNRLLSPGRSAAVRGTRQLEGGSPP